jgi:hypothetical protein
MLIAALLVALCLPALLVHADKAKTSYDECLAADAKGDLLAASSACEAAVRADPQSKSGLAAAAKLRAMQPAITEVKNAKEAADKAAQQAAAQAYDRRIETLRQVVKRRYWGMEPDGDCTGKGLPPFKWDYTGGTYSQDHDVAVADGCMRLYHSEELQTYCCPKRPLGF